MKKTLIALAALASFSAFAQSSVTISGGIGAYYGRGTAAGQAGLSNADAGATNIAFKSVEDLGGGLMLTAYAQQRMNAATGESVATGARAYQNIYTGLSGGFGSVQVGRFLTGPSGAYDAFGQYGYSTGDYADAGTVGARKDLIAQYSTPAFNGFSATVASTVTTGTAKEYTYARLSYANGPLSVSYAEQKNGTVENDKAQDIGASYDLGVAKVMVLNGKATTAAGVATSNTSVGVNVPMGATTLKASFRSGDTANATAIGVDYALSKRTGLFADAGKVTGGAQTAFRLGLRTSF